MESPFIIHMEFNVHSLLRDWIEMPLIVECVHVISIDIHPDTRCTEIGVVENDRFLVGIRPRLKQHGKGNQVQRRHDKVLTQI